MRARPIVVGAPSVSRSAAGADVVYPVEGLGTDRLTFTVSPEGSDFVDDSCDPALAALLLAAMLEGRPLRLEGAVSERLLWGIRNVVVPVVERHLPFLRPIAVEAGELRFHPAPGRAVMSPVSGGVDSFSVIQDHLLVPGVPEAHRLSHLLFAHVGHHGYGPDTDGRAASRRRGAEGIAAELGVPLVTVASNGPLFYPDSDDSPLNWLATVTVRSASVPLLLQRGVRRFLWPASGHFSEVFVRPTGHQASLDPVLLPALGTGAVALLSAGSNYSRQEKVARIAGLDIVRRYLDVCIMEGGTNCSRCEKCLRTMLALELAGQLDAFRGRFDLASYERHRTAFISRVLAERKRASHVRMARAIAARGLPVPLEARARAVALRAWRVVPESVRRVLRGMPATPEPPVPTRLRPGEGA